MQKVEDIYLPYKKKKKTKADIAKEKGLEPLSKQILHGLTLDNLFIEAKKYITEEVENEEEAVNLAYLILAQDLSETVSLREYVREKTLSSGIICSKIIEKNK